MEPKYIVIKRTHVERGLIRYEPFGYGHSISYACKVAEEWPSTADLGDILIVCDIAHVSTPEKKAQYIYAATGSGEIRAAKGVPAPLIGDDMRSNWFDVWGGEDSYPQDMHSYASRRIPELAKEALLECAEAYNFRSEKINSKGYEVSDLIDDLTTLRIANRPELRKVFSAIIAEVIPIHLIILK